MESTVTTERKISTYTFNWNISQFDTICPKECSHFAKLSSPSFTVGGDSEIKSTWSVFIRGVSSNLQCFLNLDSSAKADGTKNSESVLCNSTLIVGGDEAEAVRRSFEHGFTAGSDLGYYEIVSIKKLYEAEKTLLRNNTLKICVRMQIFGEFYNTPSKLLAPKTKKNVDTLPALASEIGELLNNKKYADLEIACCSETFYAHKAIMCARSKVFDAMFESPMEEAATSKIVLTDIDSSTFRAILLYIYTGNVATTSHTELIYGAEKYDLVGLKQHCFNELSKNVSEETIGTLAVAAEMYNADEQTKKSIKEYCQRNMVDLLKRPEFKNLVISHPKAFL